MKEVKKEDSSNLMDGEKAGVFGTGEKGGGMQVLKFSVEKMLFAVMLRMMKQKKSLWNLERN